jgi:hypothetical protein
MPIGQRTELICGWSWMDLSRSGSRAEQDSVARRKSARCSRTGLFTTRGGRLPGTPSAREFLPPQVPEYPFHDRTIRVTQCGRICIGRRKVNLSTVFGGQYVGVREVADQVWLVSFLDFDLGYFDEMVGRVEPGPNPFERRVLPMSPE